jgi:hypothetical protein
MKYFEYLEYFNFESLLNTSFFIAFFGCIVVMKILFIFIFQKVLSKGGDEYHISVFSNIIYYMIFSFFMVTVYDYNKRYKNSDFRFSNLTVHFETENTVNTIDSIGIKEKFSPNAKYSQVSTNEDESENIGENELKRLETDYNYLKTLENILTDTDQYNESYAGEICGHEDGKCQWCGKIFQLNKIYKSSYLVIGEEVGFNMAISGENWNTPLVYRCVRDYENGIKYQCVVEKEKFCSPKCEREHQLYNN